MEEKRKRLEGYKKNKMIFKKEEEKG